MIWLWAIYGFVGLIILLAFVLWVLGRRLPPTHEARVTLEIDRSRDEVWKLVADVAGQAGWAAGVTRVEWLDDRDGKEAYRQHMGRNSFVLVTTRREEPELLERTIDDDRKMFSGSWEYRLDQRNGGCRVTLTERGTIPAAIPRAIMHYLFDPAMHARKHLASLAKKFDEAPRWV